MRFRREPKVEYVEVESVKTTETVQFLCERAAGHFAMEAAKAEADGEKARAAAFEEARMYFLPQLVITGIDGSRFPEHSIGEKNWAERNGL